MEAIKEDEEFLVYKSKLTYGPYVPELDVTKVDGEIIVCAINYVGLEFRRVNESVENSSKPAFIIFRLYVDDADPERPRRDGVIVEIRAVGDEDERTVKLRMVDHEWLTIEFDNDSEEPSTSSSYSTFHNNHIVNMPLDWDFEIKSVGDPVDLDNGEPGEGPFGEWKMYWSSNFSPLNVRNYEGTATFPIVATPEESLVVWEML